MGCMHPVRYQEGTWDSPAVANSAGIRMPEEEYHGRTPATVRRKQQCHHGVPIFLSGGANIGALRFGGKE